MIVESIIFVFNFIILSATLRLLLNETGKIKILYMLAFASLIFSQIVIIIIVLKEYVI